MVYFNEHDAFAAKWLKNLWPEATVDARSIRDVVPAELSGFTQAHFFGGIGGWRYALEIAGWPEEQEVWTGSCPCQPFSCAGKRKGERDDRHLWPEFFRLISECRPATVFGEQVASADGYRWFARVRADLEKEGYAVGAADLPSAWAGAPHLRQRLFFVAYSHSERRDRQHVLLRSKEERRHKAAIPKAARSGGAGAAVDDSYCPERHWWSGPLQVGWNTIQGEVERGGRKYAAQWRVKPGLPIVAHGVSERMAKCRAIGNAIVPQVAALFIRAAREACES